MSQRWARFQGADIEIIGELRNPEIIAVGSRIRELARLQRQYGQGRWRKLKDTSLGRWPDGSIYLVEVHWYEAHGIGQFEFRVIRTLEKRP
jgi:hypothetical protein